MAAKGKISPDLLKKLKDSVNIIDVVGEHVVLRKSGANYTGLCPFHSERSPSFSVSEQKQLYHCYGCKKGGDLVSFVMEIHGVSFPEALEELAHRAGIVMPQDWGGAQDGEDPEVARRRSAAREKQGLAWKLNRFAAAFYHAQIVKQPHIEGYFQRRGVQGELARSFYVGAAPASWDALSQHLVTKQAPLPLAVELGLIKASSKQKVGGPGYFDLFRNRALFPIIDLRGKVVAFGGRGLPLPEGAPDVGGDSPKYLNSPESFLFHKSKVAFGLYQAQKHIREKNEVILVEGYFDVLALHAAGFQNVVATCGTALTPEHIQIFRRLCEKITVLFDSDRAGIQATEKAMETGLDQGLVLYGASLPLDLDPDELLFDQGTGAAHPDGKSRMEEVLRAASPLLDFRIEAISKRALEGPEAQTQALKQVAAWLARFKDPYGREIRANAAAQSLRVPRSLLDQAMGLGRVTGSGPATGRNRDSRPTHSNNSPANNAPARPPQSLPPPRKRPQKILPSERVALVALARGTEYAAPLTEARRKLPPNHSFGDLFEHLGARQLVTDIFKDPGGWERFKQVPETFMAGDVDPQVRAILTEAWVTTESPYMEAEVRAALGGRLASVWARFSQQIKKALAEAEFKKDAGLQAELMKEYLDVQRKMKEFSVFYDEA